jgi:outer membrane cobalamin receptor
MVWEMSSTGLNTIDPSSIERVEGVQGDESTTIYGAQGANKVILIFTKIKCWEGKGRFFIHCKF